MNSGGLQFFINVIDNTRLDASSELPEYTVLGRVIRGMEVVDAISRVSTGRSGKFFDIPKKPVVIQSVVWTNRDAVLGKPTYPSPKAKLQSSGTCLVVSNFSEIVTAYHVTEKATSIKIELPDGRILSASLVSSSCSINDVQTGKQALVLA